MRGLGGMFAMLDLMERQRASELDGFLELVRRAEALHAAREEAKRNPPPFSHAPAYLPRWPSEGERRAFSAAEEKRARKAARRAREVSP